MERHEKKATISQGHPGGFGAGRKGGAILAWALFLLFLPLAPLSPLIPAPMEARAQEGVEPDEQELVKMAQAMRQAGQVQFNFKNLDLVKFIRFMSELLGENILVDPSAKGSITIVSTRPVSLRESRQVMLSALEMNGLALQSEGGFSKIRSQSTGPSTDNMVRKGKAGPGYGEEYVVQVVPLEYVAAAYAQSAVSTALGGAVVFFPTETGNGAILSGKATLVQRAVSVLHALDVPDNLRDVHVVDLLYARPSVIAGYITQAGQSGASALTGVTAIGDDTRQKLVFVADRTTAKEVKRLLIEMDVPAKSSGFYVYKLQNADATTVATQLTQVLTLANAALPERAGMIGTVVVPDVPTNSIILNVPQDQYVMMEQLIRQIDVQPKQILLRGLVAEVTLNKLNQAGIDWATWGGSIGGDALVAGQVVMGESGVPSAFLEWYRSLMTHEEIKYDDRGNSYKITEYDSKALLYSYVKLLNKYDAINVLSMPRLLCTDNKESTLQVGQVIPQLKGAVSDTSNPSAVQNSYEYKETGIILKVTPHVRSGTLVALDIDQTLEEVLTTTANATPTTAKRQVKTTVLVQDGQTIILGGLIKEAEKSMKNRVPGLSYIPIVGNLFTTTVKQKEKIDLMIFLTPYILESPQEASEITRQYMVSGDVPGNPEEDLVQKRLEELYRKAVKRN
ncbi:MAG TPA: type II secretion system secretin GspD [Synergistaceae bacterium]|nr:type II secretion system secretin GspD [Synergistaceae bacterium]HQH78360.1 type II secretion system secretin GspD [Synergistaceae bacterium]